MNGVYIRDQGVFSNKTLGHGNTRVNGMSITKDGVCGYSFISMQDIESWESSFEMFSHGESSRCHSPFSNVFLIVSALFYENKVLTCYSLWLWVADHACGQKWCMY